MPHQLQRRNEPQRPHTSQHHIPTHTLPEFLEDEFSNFPEEGETEPYIQEEDSFEDDGSTDPLTFSSEEDELFIAEPVDDAEAGSIADDDGVMDLPMLNGEDENPDWPEGGDFVQESSCPVEFPLPRAYPGSRPLNPKAVLNLIPSIAIMGIINGVTTDRNYRIIAGAHRWAACLLLRTPVIERRQVWVETFAAEPSPANLSAIEAYTHIPDLVLPYTYTDYDSVLDPGRAFELEVTENRQRKGYSPEEIRNLISRLLQMGYTSRSGKPKKGEMPLSKGLELFGITKAMARSAREEKVVIASNNAITKSKLRKKVEGLQQELDKLDPKFARLARALSLQLRSLVVQTEALIG